jgi:hypothetical protein
MTAWILVASPIPLGLMPPDASQYESGVADSGLASVGK